VILKYKQHSYITLLQYETVMNLTNKEA